MNINNIDKMFSYLSNKAQAGNVTPQRRNLAYDLANKLMYRKYFGLPEGWVPGSPLVGYSVSQQTEEIIARFKETFTFTINTLGLANRPSDFIHTSTIDYITANAGVVETTPVKICNDTEFQEAETSYMVPATKDNPVCNFIGTQVRFAPKNLINCKMVYLRMPVTPFWNSTFTNNRPVYNPTGSIDPEWPDDLEIEFVVTAVQSAGVSMQRELLFQEMGQYKNNAT